MDGQRLQVTKPILNFMIRQSIVKDFVRKSVQPAIKNKLTTIGGGLVCINMQNVQGFDIKPCQDRSHALVNAQFKSGRKSFLYAIPESRMFDERNILSIKLNSSQEQFAVDEIE